MKIIVIGAGPAGLYLAYLLRRDRPDADIRVFEQNAPDATFGFGVVFSDRALAFLKDDDPATCDAIEPHLESWQDITVVHRGRSMTIDGIGFSAIGRLHLLKLLQERLSSVGIAPVYRHSIDSLSDFADADLIVGAEGAAGSLVRRTYEPHFGTTTVPLNNRFAWFGTTKRFETLTQTFVETERGYFNAHHYRYAPDMSTFIVEADEETFRRYGFEHISETDSKNICETVFAEFLDGHPLVTNRSIWRRFPKIGNERWSYRNCVLVGDALRTAHFSIGSGTRLALEDVIALAKALAAHGDDVQAALQTYEAARRPVVEKLVSAANASAAWYEAFPTHMGLDTVDFVMSYLRRSGRLDINRLRQISPRFVATYETERPRGAITR